MAPSVIAAGQWTERRRRAVELTERWPFAAEVLTLFGALLDAQEQIYQAARAELPDPSLIAAYVAERALPMIREVTVAKGPERLARAAAATAAAGEAHVRCWLEGGDLSAVDRYFARAATGPVLEALGPAAGAACAGTRDERHCPRCSGLPQVSVLAMAEDALVAPRRYLECSRCAWRWPYPRMTCSGCGETEGHQQRIFAEEGATEVEATGTVVRGVGGAAARPAPHSPRFPHISIHACRTCSRYLFNIDLTRDPRAVPLVDELAALPLGLFAGEQGLMKVVPNLMGF